MATKKKKKKLVSKKSPKKKTAKKPKASARKRGGSAAKFGGKKKAKSQKKSAPKTGKAAIKKDQIIGEVTHYFDHVQAAVVKLKKPLKVGDNIQIKGATTDFKQRVNSMQIDHVAIQTGKKGDEIGLEVKDRVRAGDLVILP